MAILSKYNLDRYQYGIDVSKRHQLYGMSGKLIFEGKWLTKGNKTVIIVEMNQDISQREAEFYLKVNNHRNIIQTFGYIDSTPDWTIFMQEYARFNDLGSVLLDNQIHFTQTILLEIFIQIADAMRYVAQQRIVHGDLGCRNVLVFRVDENEPKNNQVKLTDFGLARWMDQPLISEEDEIVPIRFCAPEILKQKQHKSFTEKSDVYSFAVFIWEALSNGEMPYSSVAKDEIVTTKKLEYEKLPIPKVCDNQLWTLMNTCWHRNPDQRPSFDEIKRDLVSMNIIDIPADLITESSHRAQLQCKYELDRDVKIGRKLNKGSPAIYEAEWIVEDREPVIIIEQNSIPSEDEQLFYTAFKKNKHIVHTYGYVGNDRGTTMILQERAPFGSLQSLLRSGQFRPTLAVLLQIFIQIIDVMVDIIGAGLVHGDLRCENVLVFEMHPTDPKQNLVKLCNFCLAHKNDPTIVDNRRLNIPVRYCALEILRSVGRSNYSEYSDVYSMGVLMWQALSNGGIPYESSITQAEVHQRKLNKELLQRPSHVQANLWQIIVDCWYNEINCRFQFEQIKIRLSQVPPAPPIRTIPCQSCRKEIPEHEMATHLKSCKQPLPHRKDHTNPGFIRDEEVPVPTPPPRDIHRSPKTNNKRRHSPDRREVGTTIKYTSCAYCSEKVVNLTEHLKTCLVAQQFVTIRKPPVSVVPPTQPSSTVRNLTVADPPESKSFFRRLCSCFC